MIVATAPAVERRERLPYNPRSVDKFDLSIEDDPMHEFSTMSVVDFLAKIVVQKRDGKPRPLYRLGRAKKMTTKQAPRKKKLRSAGFSNPNALKLDIPTPPTLRECLARGLFGSGISPRGHREMSVEHSKQLIERYPSLYRLADASPVPSSPPFAREGFACGDGWFEVINRLSAKLSADPNLVVGQLKEKFGLLRVYFEPSPLPSDEVEEATDAALAEAVAESRVTCEWCGKPGKHAQREGHLSVRCGACAAKEARRRLRELLTPWMRRLLALREKTVFDRSGLLAASGEQSRLDLSPEHALALLEKYPASFARHGSRRRTRRADSPADGFEIGDGWFGIVDRLSAKLAKDTALYVVQVKEKYGRLKVYWERDESAPRDPRLDAEIEAAIDEAADESERTCEVCGEPGTHRGAAPLVECPVRTLRSDRRDLCRMRAHRGAGEGHGPGRVLRERERPGRRQACPGEDRPCGGRSAPGIEGQAPGHRLAEAGAARHRPCTRG